MRRSSTATSFCELNVLSETEASFLLLEVNVQETDRCIQLADGLLILAEKGLSAFIRAVDRLFGVEQARQSALNWIKELERMDWPCGESIPEWRRATVGARLRDTDEKVYGYSLEWPLTVGAPASGGTACDKAVVLRTIYEVLMPASSHFNY
jgi:hypothetical protein